MCVSLSFCVFLFGLFNLIAAGRFRFHFRLPLSIPLGPYDRIGQKEWSSARPT